jgi:lipopolysaccharide biosynthesis protein
VSVRRIAYFAHFSVDGRVRRYVFRHLAALREVCSEVVFASNSPLGAGDRASLGRVATTVFERANEGFDFAMWKDGFSRVDPAPFDEVVLTNSSVFGPTVPLAPLFLRMKKSGADVWGITDNEELGWHLQSYFLVFTRKAHTSAAFHAFWDDVRALGDKQEVIVRYEVGLSARLVAAGLSLRAAVPLSILPRREGNPTMFQPAALMAAGCPFVKVELLRDNPYGVPLGRVRRKLELLGYDASLLEFDRPPTKRRAGG